MCTEIANSAKVSFGQKGPWARFCSTTCRVLSAYHKKRIRRCIQPAGQGDMSAPLLPPEPPKPKGGRPRVSDRAALTGILFVLKTGIPWEYLPAEMGAGAG